MVSRFTFTLGHDPEWDAPCVNKVPHASGGFVRYSDYEALRTELEQVRRERDEARQALEEIRDLKERPYEEFPADWREQIAACPECKRYADHPIQRGICDKHRRPLYAREDHDKHETKILGYRAKDIARDALARRAREGGNNG